MKIILLNIIILNFIILINALDFKKYYENEMKDFDNEKNYPRKSLFDFLKEELKMIE